MLRACQQLAEWGYTIVALSGDYCRASRGGADFLLRWDGEAWVVM